MPRIDPDQLLKCLSVLLNQHGGIKSSGEVLRIVTLMLRFSKKLVSKCIYINILKSTETEILGSFMTNGGWTMTLTWLNEAIVSKNWALIQEILELLFLCPVDVERLKSNTFPRKVKALSKDASHLGVQYLATVLVDRWLRVVKGESVSPLVSSEIPVPPITIVKSEPEISVEDSLHGLECAVNDIKNDVIFSDDVIKHEVVSKSEVDTSDSCDIKPKSEVSDIDTSDVVDSSTLDSSSSVKKSQVKASEHDKKKSEHKSSSSKKSSRSRRSNDEKSERRSTDSKSGNSSDKSGSSSNKSRDHSKKDNDKDKDNSKKDKSRDKSREKEKSRDKSSDKYRDKDKRRPNDNKSRSDASKSKDKNLSSIKSSNEKSLSGIKPTMSISDLGKIPKKKPQSDDSTDVNKAKHSISIEVRKSTDTGRPKTVKMFNSKFRSHGLEEEAKPPPPRGQVKKPAAPAVPPAVPKRASPLRSSDAPPEKKLKISEMVEKPGAIKLIPPKPKPIFLQESVLFMDALTASANNKKEPKRKKRKLSVSKETTNDGSPPTSPSTPTSQQSSPAADLPKAAPFRFYQDTLDTEESKENKDVTKDNFENDSDMKEPENESDSITMKSPLMSPPPKLKDDSFEEPNEREQIEIVDVQPEPFIGLKSILTHHKVKGSKKSLKWKDTNLVEIRHFELDENERTNVSKNNFLDMKQLERVHERESFQKSKSLRYDDLMTEQTPWRRLIPIEAPEIEYGKKSKEKDVEEARQAVVLEFLRMEGVQLPDNPSEPDYGQHQAADPITIPLDDISGGSDNIEDLSDRPWPEPKAFAPLPAVNPPGMGPTPNVYSPMPPFGPGFPNPAMPGPMFPPGPGPMPGEWPMNAPNMMMPPNGMNGAPEMFMAPFQQPPMGSEFPMMDMSTMNGPMFPPGFPGMMGNMMPNGPMMARPNGPNGPPNGPPYGFNNRGGGGGGGNNRGTSHNRGGPGGGSWRGGWSGPPRGGGSNVRGNTKRCIHFQKKGFCREGSNCHFAHY